MKPPLLKRNPRGDAEALQRQFEFEPAPARIVPAVPICAQTLGLLAQLLLDVSKSPPGAGSAQNPPAHSRASNNHTQNEC
jgi:hypothetical protein